MKKILLLFALLPLFAWGQKSVSFSKSGSGDLSLSDTASLLATQYDLATSVGITYPGAGIPLSTGIAWGASITNNSTNWNTAYTDRLKWDGGSTGLVAATGRTSLGATTVGKALFMIANPGAVAFLRINADSTVSSLSATNFKTALSLENVTNESKATMFTAPTFTGSATFGTIANSLIPTTNDVVTLGNTTYKIADLWLATGGVINMNSGDVTLTHGTNMLTIGGGGLTIGSAYSIAMTGSIGATGARVTKIWAADLEITNSPTINGTAISATYAPLASPTFTGTPKIVADTVSTKAYARSVSGVTGKLNLADSVNYASGYMSRYDGVIGLAGKLALADSGTYAGGYSTPTDLDEALAAYSLTDTVALEKIVTLQSDTVALATYGLGSGRIADTALFQDNVLIGSFYNKGSDSLIITSLKCYLYAGSGTESVIVNIAWSDTIMAVVPVKLNTSGYTVTSHVVGNEDTSFNNATIPPNKLVYGWISGNVAGNKPSYLSVTLSGHKINRKY